MRNSDSLEEEVLCSNISFIPYFLDGSVELIGVLLYGPGKGSSVLHSVRDSGLPLVDDWTCLKSMVKTKN